MPTLSGPVFTFRYGTHQRRYAVLTLPLCEAVEVMEVRPFDALKTWGEQRTEIATHTAALARAVVAGAFTPTAWAANVPPALRAGVEFTKDGDAEEFRLQVGGKKLLVQTDGGHRRASLLRLLEEAEAELAKAATEEERLTAEALVEAIMLTPVTFLLYFDGESRTDFSNLQKGRPMDRSHYLALRIANAEFEDEAYGMAFDLARLLHCGKQSPFYGQIRFDSRGKCSLPVATLCAQSSSDLSTSLIGAAKVAISLGQDERDLSLIFEHLKEAVYGRYPELVEYPSPIALIPGNGKLGNSTMWAGLAICLCYALKGDPPAGSRWLREAVESAYETLRESPRGNFSAGTKRLLLGGFAKHFFRDIREEVHDGIPVGLLRIIPASGFAARALPRSLREACA